MWQEKIDVIKRIEYGYNSKLNDGARPDEIKTLNLKFTMKMKCSLPEEYLAALELINGIDFNGFVLYGIDPEILLNQPNQEIQGIIDSNEVWYEFVDPERKFIFLGDDSISWYVYEKDTEKYWLIDRPSTDPIEAFSTFDKLFDKMLETALL